MKSPFWMFRPLLNPDDVYQWLISQKVKKAIPPDQLHLTLTTVRESADWSGIETHNDTIEVHQAEMPVQIFGWSMKAIAFEDQRIVDRIREMSVRFPSMDHARLARPHLSTHRGGILPKEPYTGKLVFGPEQIMEFNERSARDIVHIKLKSEFPADAAEPNRSRHKQKYPR